MKTQPAEDTIHLKSYVIGYAGSLLLTLTAFFLVSQHVSSNHAALPHAFLIPVLGLLAISQFVIQLVFFLHLRAERKPRWRLFVFWFMILVVAILVLGSLWIMQNLNDNMMMSPGETKVYMHSHEGF